MTDNRDRECHERRKKRRGRVGNERKMYASKRAKCIEKRQRKNIKGEETEEDKGEEEKE